jgi:methylated-DNA-[protein]-cysteine S-methyltransferase
MSQILIDYFKTPFGELIMGSLNDELCLCDWRYRKMRDSIDKRIQSGTKADFREEKTEIIEKAQEQLSEYFNRNRKSFDLPLNLIGTDFQKEVWNGLIKIPYGETRSYDDLARKTDNEGAVRAVASANGANAFAIIIPCHRIIGSDGSLTGYAGGLSSKDELLKLEGVRLSDQLKLDL